MSLPTYKIKKIKATDNNTYEIIPERLQGTDNKYSFSVGQSLKSNSTRIYFDRNYENNLISLLQGLTYSSSNPLNIPICNLMTITNPNYGSANYYLLAVDLTSQNLGYCLATFDDYSASSTYHLTVRYGTVAGSGYGMTWTQGYNNLDGSDGFYFIGEDLATCTVASLSSGSSWNGSIIYSDEGTSSGSGNKYEAKLPPLSHDSVIALQDSLDNYVDKTTNQEIDGIKTFLDRPLSKDIYTQLAYIQSPATSASVFPYIRTGIIKGVQYTTKLTCILDGYFTASQSLGFCGYDSGGQLGQSSGVWSTEAGSSSVNCVGSSNRATIKQVIDFSNAKDTLYKVSGSTETQIAQRSISSASGYATAADYPLFVAYNGAFSYKPAKLVMYSFKMYDQNDTLLRDYIPVRNSKNEIGLLDLVENKFYKNLGNEDFIAGSDVSTLAIDSQLLTSDDVAAVALSGSYLDLSNKPTIISDVKINNTTVVSSGQANIVTNTAYNASTNKIATMSDISSAVNNNTITLTQGGVTKGSFTLNQNSDTTISLDAGGGSEDYDELIHKPIINLTGSSGADPFYTGQSVTMGTDRIYFKPGSESELTSWLNSLSSAEYLVQLGGDAGLYYTSDNGNKLICCGTDKNYVLFATGSGTYEGESYTQGFNNLDSNNSFGWIEPMPSEYIGYSFTVSNVMSGDWNGSLVACNNNFGSYDEGVYYKMPDEDGFGKFTLGEELAIGDKIYFDKSKESELLSYIQSVCPSSGDVFFAMSLSNDSGLMFMNLDGSVYGITLMERYSSTPVYLSQALQTFPQGWQADVDENGGVALQEAHSVTRLDGDAKNGILFGKFVQSSGAIYRCVNGSLKKVLNEGDIVQENNVLDGGSMSSYYDLLVNGYTTYTMPTSIFNKINENKDKNYVVRVTGSYSGMTAYMYFRVNATASTNDIILDSIIMDSTSYYFGSAFTSNGLTQTLYYSQVGISDIHEHANKSVLDNIASQTAYSSKGTSTKVPTITTNTSGQVTSISETDIDFPVSDVQINGTSILSSKVANLITNSAYNSSSNKIATMNDLPSSVTLTATSGSEAIADSSNSINVMTRDTTQTITGFKTFNAPTNIASTEQQTVKLKTSNGGAIIFGKEGPNSGSMIRLDQTDGTCRLRFRSSATAGAMVWEQPEAGSRLYMDFKDSSSNTYRVSSPTVAGTIAVIGASGQTGSFYATNVYASSDQRLKENIKDVELDCGKVIDQLNIKEFNFKTDENKKVVVGAIAQDLQSILPDKYRANLVSGSKDTYYSINEGKLLYIAIQALKEEREKVKNLEDRIGRLEKILLED